MSKKLVVYFSKADEQYSVGVIEKGNTKILAELIASNVGADIFEIKVKNDKYPKTYMALTKYAKQEKELNTYPEIIDFTYNFDDYDTIFIGCPNWWGDAPMPVYSFLKKYDFSNKNIAIFVTHEGSGGSNISTNISKFTNPKKTLKYFDTYGSSTQNDKANVEKNVKQWLKDINVN